MDPEVVDTGLKLSEQSEQASSPHAHPPFRGPESSSTGHQVPGDMVITPNEIQRVTPVDTVDSTAADLLKSAVEDGPGESCSMAERKV